MKGTNERAHGNLKCFDIYRGLCPLEEHEYMWTHCNDGVTYFRVRVTGEEAEGEGEGKKKESYLRLIPELCLEDRMN
jgi:hypothetical protein